MAGVVNVVYATPDDRSDKQVYLAGFHSAENVATSAASATTTGTARRRGDVARITAVTGACYVGKPSTTAVNAQGWYLAEGATIDLGGLEAGGKITVIEAS